MKRGYIGPFQLGILSGQSEALKFLARLTQEPETDIEGIFYAVAFQAGVDEFLLPQLSDFRRPQSRFVADRITIISGKESDKRWQLVNQAFSTHLPDDWQRNDEYQVAWELKAFVADLLDSMSTGAALLSPWGIPDMLEAKAKLPSELFVPMESLLKTFTDFQVSSPIVGKAVATEDVRRYKEILLGDLFERYSAAQAALDDLESPTATALPRVADTGRKLFTRYSRLLRFRRAGLSILQVTPKVVDTVFGKLPGALAEFAANLGIGLLESRRRIVVYDFRITVRDIMLSNLLRMLKAADHKGIQPPQPD